MTELTNDELWGDDQIKYHKHKCIKCGIEDDCSGTDCDIKEDAYLCFPCWIENDTGLEK
jgi:hypothetical protein